MPLEEAPQAPKRQHALTSQSPRHCEESGWAQGGQEGGRQGTSPANNYSGVALTSALASVEHTPSDWGSMNISQMLPPTSGAAKQLCQHGEGRSTHTSQQSPQGTQETPLFIRVRLWNLYSTVQCPHLSSLGCWPGSRRQLSQGCPQKAQRAS